MIDIRGILRSLSGAGVLAAVIAATGASASRPVIAQTPLVIDLAEDTNVVRVDGEQVEDGTGVAVASCDINGDGIEDLAIGADEADGPGDTRSACGEVYVIYGKRGAWTGPYDIATERDVRIIGQEETDALGQGVACGDVNGDGYGDLVLCAPWAQRFRDGSWTMGQAHVIFGGPSLPAEIDLLTDPGVVIHGAFDYGQLCHRPVVADLDGDGTGDLALDDRNVESKTGEWYSGRVYLLFGRSEWPAEIDLRDGGDVTIFGEYKDELGNNLAAGDLDADGTADLVVQARSGDGPDNVRWDAGDIFVFHGRSSWPVEIDLATESADMVLYGPDLYDRAGEQLGLDCGDPDLDGTTELVVGIRLADGPTNESSRTGEARLYGPGTSWPASVELATESETVIYGAEEGDGYGYAMRVGDVNGNRKDDLAGAAPFADGPGNTREDGGEVTVFFGQPSLPPTLELNTDDPDLIVYGGLAGDMLKVKHLSDVNGDGVDEIVSTSAVADSTRVSSVWLISPFDIDGDGVTQLPDNCPLVANPDQTDSDGNQIGDACEGDYDGDGLGDDQDCAPGDASGGTPPEVTGLHFDGGSKSLLVWDAAPFADLYDISRGLVSQLDGSDYGECQNDRDPDRSDTAFEDPDIPDSGTGLFYLVRGHNLACPAPGTYGTGSGGTERINHNAQACP